MVRLCAFFTFISTLASALEAGHVDTHIHALPPPYINALAAAGGDPWGFSTPDWTLEATIRSMDQTQTSFAILSLSTPGIPIAGTGEAARTLTRTLNNYFGNATNEACYRNRIGFFGVLPDWQDVNGTLNELDYLYRKQKLCNGVTAYTTYGDKLLGDPMFAPIWEKLQKYKALVFVHPGALAVNPTFIASALPQSIVDFPLATTRSAVDLVMTRTLRRCPDVDVILSHAGGAVPFIGRRAIGSLTIPEVAKAMAYNSMQAQDDFKRFYYDIAGSTSSAQLNGLLDFAESSHILFGSDFPYAPQPAINTLLDEYTAFVTSNSRGGLVNPESLTKNALELLNKHAQKKRF
ncbi:hypothetical protein B0J13DRAFT_445152 [Dactylonectria estremocensis]|uniref:6-methylsalicylate decarboxylase n=1 Tax=Dactylonectria estremocensis TaxID=1079267 RepID=A0A9P9ES85_9HYPO|nr:hypothetical protein B0J13DRAFT_445152 [Dactylonectria estremocensis]